MSAQAAEPFTPPGGFEAIGEFHPISVVLAEDYTEITCTACGPLEHTGRLFEGHTAHGADHAIATGHIVTEKHVKVTVITGHPS